MDTIISTCATIWDRICSFTQIAWQWTRCKISEFFNWFTTTLGDLIASVKNLCNSSALDSEDKIFLSKLMKKLQGVNNDMPRLKRIIEKAGQSNSDHEKKEAAETLEAVGDTFRPLGGSKQCTLELEVQ